MTNKREELIEKAAKAILTASHGEDYGDWEGPLERELYMKRARAAFAAFEQVHTPTDDQSMSEQQEEQSYGNRGADHEEQQAYGGAAAGRLAVRGAHAKSMAHPSADDDREALALIAEVKAYPPVAEWDEPGEVDVVLARLTAALGSALRRPVQGDPREVAHIACDCVPDLGPEHCHLCGARNGTPTTWADCASRVAVQGEPTDSWVGRARRAEAALLRVRDIHIATTEALSETFSAAAVTVQGENHG